MTSRASALTTASLANEPVSASTTATTDVKITALAGVRKRGWMRPKNAGSSPCSASANSIRDPLNTWPALLPVIEITEPTPTSSAPIDPSNTAAASAIGVLCAGRSGSRPCATTCASVITPITARIVRTSANGTCRRGSTASPAGTGTTSYPPYTKIISSAAAENWPSVTAGSVVKAVPST